MGRNAGRSIQKTTIANTKWSSFGSDQNKEKLLHKSTDRIKVLTSVEKHTSEQRVRE